MNPFHFMEIFVALSQASSDTKVYHLQFTCQDPILLAKLDKDVKSSDYSSRPKYFRALLGKVLSFQTGSNLPSCLAQLFELIELFESLPIERIRQLAPSQNRSFGQMVKHLLEIALKYYAEDAQQPILPKEVTVPKTITPRRKSDRRSARSVLIFSEPAIRA